MLCIFEVRMTEKKLTERQEALVDALMGEANGDFRTAMRIAGYSDNTSIKEAVAPIREHIVDAAQTMMAINAPKAAASLAGVFHDPSALGARNIVAAAKEVLDRSGVVKKEQIEVKGPEGGIFILPPKNETE
jgi:hypothetical protein